MIAAFKLLSIVVLQRAGRNIFKVTILIIIEYKFKDFNKLYLNAKLFNFSNFEEYIFSQNNFIREDNIAIVCSILKQSCGKSAPYLTSIYLCSPDSVGNQSLRTFQQLNVIYTIYN